MKTKTRFLVNWTGSQKAFDSINECLTAFLATRKRECSVSQVTEDGSGLYTFRIGLSSHGQGSYYQRFNRASAHAFLTGA